MLHTEVSPGRWIRVADAVIHIGIRTGLTALFASFAYYILGTLLSGATFLAEMQHVGWMIFLFSLLWNLLLYNGVAAACTLVIIALSTGASCVAFVLKSDFQKNITGYMQWFSNVFWKMDTSREQYVLLTSLGLMLLTTLLMAVFVSRPGGIGGATFVLLPFTLYAELFDKTSVLPAFSLLFFGLALFYMLHRQENYLDVRLGEKSEISYSLTPALMMLPACLLACVVALWVGKMPEGRWSESRLNLFFSASYAENVTRAENNLFSLLEPVDYDNDPVCIEDEGGVLLNNSSVETLTLEDIPEDSSWYYLRSRSYRTYQDGWENVPVSGETLDTASSPDALAQSEIDYALRLLTRRGISSDADNNLLELRQKMVRTKITVNYSNILTNAIFNLPLSAGLHQQSARQTILLSDSNGSGVFSESTLEENYSYVIEYISLPEGTDKLELLSLFDKGFYSNVTREEADGIYGEQLNEFESYASSLYENYTDLDDPTGEIRAAADAMVEDIPEASSAEKAWTIARWLSDNRKLTETKLAADAGDTLTSFITGEEGRNEGNVLEFAGACVLLCRAEGIPARLAVGYLAQGSGKDTLSVRQKNEHAWAEIYLEGLGWVSVEACPDTGESAASVLTGENSETTGNTFRALLKNTSPGEVGLLFFNGFVTFLLTILRIVLTVAFLALLLLLLLLGWNWFVRTRALHTDGFAGIEDVCDLLLQSAMLAGFAPTAGLTRKEIFSRLPEGNELARGLERLYDAYYGGTSYPYDADRLFRGTLRHYTRWLRYFSPRGKGWGRLWWKAHLYPLTLPAFVLPLCRWVHSLPGRLRSALKRG